MLMHLGEVSRARVPDSLSRRIKADSRARQLQPQAVRNDHQAHPFESECRKRPRLVQHRLQTWSEHALISLILAALSHRPNSASEATPASASTSGSPTHTARHNQAVQTASPFWYACLRLTNSTWPERLTLETRALHIRQTNV